MQQNTTVAKYLSGRVLVTIFLGFYAVLWALIIAIPLAVYQAYKRDSQFDRGGNFMSFLFVSLPALVLAPFIIFLFVVKLGWFPRIGEKIMPWDDLGAHFRNFFLPVVVLTLPLAAIFARLLRSDMIQTLQSDFVTLASAKGVPPGRVLWTHALRNSLFSLLTSVGVQLGGIVGGALGGRAVLQHERHGLPADHIDPVQRPVRRAVGDGHRRCSRVGRQPRHRPAVRGHRPPHPPRTGIDVSRPR